MSPAETTLPTVADVVGMAATQLGRPQIVAGEAHLARRVRWLHVSELPEIDEVLRGGELVLTTGIALPDTEQAWETYVGRLVHAGASGLVLELGTRFAGAPKTLVVACDRNAVPLIVLRRPVEFVRLTEAVHTRILERQMAALRLSDTAQEVFTALAMSGAGVADIVAQAARMADAPVVFEDLVRHVLACHPVDRPVEDVLNRWSSRSREAISTTRTAVCGPEEWVVTSVEVHGEVVGRLVLLPRHRPTAEHHVIVERASVALTLNRLLDPDRESLELQARRSILADLIEQRHGSDEDVFARTDAIGIPLRRKTLIGVLVRPDGSGTGSRQVRDTSRIVAEAALAASIPVLQTPWSAGAMGLLVVMPDDDRRTAVLTRLAQEVRSRGGAHPPHISVGSSVSKVSDVRRSFLEAAQVDRARRKADDDKLFCELPGLGMRGLLFTLAGDPRLQAYVARTLDPVLEYDAQHGTDLLRLLSIHLDCRGNKSEAARTAAVSRAAFYERLDIIGRILQVDLTSGEVCTSLHAAIMALDAVSADESQPSAS